MLSSEIVLLAVTLKEERIPSDSLDPIADGFPSILPRCTRSSKALRVVNDGTRQMVDPARQVISQGPSVGLASHTMLLTRNGRELPIGECGSSIVDDGGEITGAVLEFRDISQRRQMEETLHGAQAELAHVARLRHCHGISFEAELSADARLVVGHRIPSQWVILKLVSNDIDMGLSIWPSIVEAHGGRLWASSISPHDRIFRFTVPRSANETSFDPAA